MRLIRILSLLWVITGLALLTPQAQAQQAVSFPVVELYDLDSTSFTYPLFTPRGPGRSELETSGSSTTVSAITGAPANALENIGVGDVLHINLGDTPTIRRVTACTPACGVGATSVTVDSAVDLTGGYTYNLLHLTDGTGAGQGWVDCSCCTSQTFIVNFDQGDATTVQAQVEVRGSAFGAATPAISAVTLAAAPTGQPFAILEPQYQCRVGLKLATDTSDAGANIEKLSIYFIGTRRQP